jgi:hypothetical protein
VAKKVQQKLENSRKLSFDMALEIAKIRNLDSLTAKNNQETVTAINGQYGGMKQMGKP